MNKRRVALAVLCFSIFLVPMVASCSPDSLPVDRLELTTDAKIPNPSVLSINAEKDNQDSLLVEDDLTTWKMPESSWTEVYRDDETRLSIYEINTDLAAALRKVEYALFERNAAGQVRMIQAGKPTLSSFFSAHAIIHEGSMIVWGLLEERGMNDAGQMVDTDVASAVLTVADKKLEADNVKNTFFFSLDAEVELSSLGFYDGSGVALGGTRRGLNRLDLDSIWLPGAQEPAVDEAEDPGEWGAEDAAMTMLQVSSDDRFILYDIYPGEVEQAAGYTAYSIYEVNKDNLIRYVDSINRYPEMESYYTMTTVVQDNKTIIYGVIDQLCIEQTNGRLAKSAVLTVEGRNHQQFLVDGTFLLVLDGEKTVDQIKFYDESGLELTD